MVFVGLLCSTLCFIQCVKPILRHCTWFSCHSVSQPSARFLGERLYVGDLSFCFAARISAGYIVSWDQAVRWKRRTREPGSGRSHVHLSRVRRPWHRTPPVERAAVVATPGVELAAPRPVPPAARRQVPRASTPTGPWPPLARGTPLHSWRPSTKERTLPKTVRTQRGAAPGPRETQSQRQGLPAAACKTSPSGSRCLPAMSADGARSRQPPSAGAPTTFILLIYFAAGIGTLRRPAFLSTSNCPTDRWCALVPSPTCAGGRGPATGFAVKRARCPRRPPTRPQRHHQTTQKVAPCVAG